MSVKVPHVGSRVRARITEKGAEEGSPFATLGGRVVCHLLRVGLVQLLYPVPAIQCAPAQQFKGGAREKEARMPDAEFRELPHPVVGFPHLRALLFARFTVRGQVLAVVGEELVSAPADTAHSSQTNVVWMKRFIGWMRDYFRAAVARESSERRFSDGRVRLVEVVAGPAREMHYLTVAQINAVMVVAAAVDPDVISPTHLLPLL